MSNISAILIDGNNERISGTLEFQDFQVVFIGEGKKTTIPISQLNISLGGAANKLLFFTNPSQPKITIYTSDHQVLKNAALKNHPFLTQQIKTVKKKKNILKLSFYSILGLFLAFFLSIYLFKDYFVRKIAEQAPVEWEQKIGEHLFTTLSHQYTFIKNDSLENVFRVQAAPLLQQIKKDGTTVEIYFTKDPTINAFALPGGKVIIQSGLIENAKSWEEVLGVLSHELAHVTQRHHLRGVITNIGLYGIIAAFFGDMSAIAGTVVNTGGELASLSNSRDFETEADEVGMKYLYQANIDPKGLIDFFQTLEKQNHSIVDKNLSFLSTHPATQDRISHLRTEFKKLPKKKYLIFTSEFDSFKLSLKKS